MLSNKDGLKGNKFHRTLYWICREWKVLPTEKRFLDLTPQQINWLVYWHEHFDDAPSEEIPSNVQDILKHDDNQEEASNKSSMQSSIQKIEDMVKVFEDGGDVTDWDDVTKDFLGADGTNE